MSDSNRRPTAYRTTSAFAALSVCGLDYPFTMLPKQRRCLPSSLYTFPTNTPLCHCNATEANPSFTERLYWLGSGLACPLQDLAFPEFERFYS